MLLFIKREIDNIKVHRISKISDMQEKRNHVSDEQLGAINISEVLMSNV